MSSQIEINHFNFEELYVQYHARFVIIARRYVRDIMVAEDIVTDSFLTFWERREAKSGAEINVPAYLLTIVKNNCLNYLSAQQRHLRIEQHIHTTQSRLVDASIRSLDMCDPNLLFAKEVSQIVERELESMPELTRFIFEASRFRDKTYAEIAQEYGVSVRRVTSEIQTALSTLRSALKDYLPMASFVLVFKWLGL